MQFVGTTDCFKEQTDGTLFQADYTNQENLLTWLLAFRDKVELLEPKELREERRHSIDS
ncbi:MAG: WYL domain-containing protein [Frisingicoccus sp.]|nr:WYL domain-containing protein [Frisingicoccus sp.]